MERCFLSRPLAIIAKTRISKTGVAISSRGSIAISKTSISKSGISKSTTSISSVKESSISLSLRLSISRPLSIVGIRSSVSSIAKTSIAETSIAKTISTISIGSIEQSGIGVSLSLRLGGSQSSTADLKNGGFKAVSMVFF